MAIGTTKRKTTTRKTTTRKKPTSVAASAPSTAAGDYPVVPVSAPELVGETDQDGLQDELKKKELIDLVVERSNIKKKDAKPVVEAMLAVLGESIAAGREFNLHPLGKLRINRTTDKDNGRVIVCKLRQSLPREPGSTTTLAEIPDNL